MEYPFERAAMHGAEIPAGLNGAEQIFYLGLRYLHQQYRKGEISKEIAIADKAKLVREFNANQQSLKMFQHSVDVWKRAELAAIEYSKHPSIENGDKFYAAVYDCPVDWRKAKIGKESEGRG